MGVTPARITESFAVREVPRKMRGGRQVVKLMEPLEYHIGTENSAEVIVVPSGFETDFASIPFGMRNLFPPLGLHARAAIVHDFLYMTKGDLPHALDYVQDMMKPDEMTAYLNLTANRPNVNARTYSRRESDDIFREAMQVVGVNALQRNIMHRAVRLGGGGGWGS